MSRSSRRHFLRGFGAAGLGAAGLGLAACDGEAPGASPTPLADPGAPPPGSGGRELTADELAALLPESARPDGILDLFLLGGLNPFDTFYVVEEHGRPNPNDPNSAGEMWHAFADYEESIPDWFQRCDGGNRPLLEPFGLDAAGFTVNLGPFLYPLRDRPDITSRMRIVVMRHEETTHQSGVPYGLCGHRRNTPRLAGTGAHLQAHLHATRGARTTPDSYVLLPGLQDLSALNADSAAAMGLHSGSARPMTLRLNAGGVEVDALRRVALGDHVDVVDAAVAQYQKQFARRMAFSGNGEVVRSAAWSDYISGRAGLLAAPDVVNLLDPTALGPQEGMECEQFGSPDYTKMGLDIATQLLTHPTSPAAYVSDVDGGLAAASGGGAYDTHFFHVPESARNVTHMARELAARINEPGEEDPRKLDLDRHMVMLTTEYGRSPKQIGGGLDHWPYGYVQVLIGGPVTEEQAGVVGSIDPFANADGGFNPADFRAAALLATGIWPFSDRSFAVGDISAGNNERDCAMYLREELLGYRS